MSLLETLARKFNVYMEKEATVVPLLLRRAAAYITNLFTIFGLIEKSSEIGFPITSGGGDLETTVTPYLDVIRDFRQVRSILFSSKSFYFFVSREIESKIETQYLTCISFFLISLGCSWVC